MPFYPLPPILVACLALGIVASSLAASPLFVVLALGFVGAGLPVFWLFVDPRRPVHAAASAACAKLSRACCGSAVGGGSSAQLSERKPLHTSRPQRAGV